MKREEFKNRLDSSGIPVAYGSFPENAAPPLPFICYMMPATNNMYADGKVYQKIDSIRVELYQRFIDPAIEEKVEDALDLFCWQKTLEEYIPEERCWVTVYEMED